MKKNHLRAIMFLVLASILWSSGGILIKLVDWNPVAIAGSRSGISAIVMMLYMKKVKVKLTKVKTVGAFTYAATVILFVIGNKLTTAANVILLQYTAPIWVAIFAGWILKEKTQNHDWIAIIFVMFGMAMFFMGDLGGGQMLGNVISVFSGVALAGVVISLKLQKDGPPVEMVYVGNLITFFVSIPFILQSMPDFKSIIGIILLGVFQLGIAYILFAEAINHLTAIEAILIPVIEPLLNPIWVFMFVGEVPGGMALLGGTVVVTAVVTRGVYTNIKEKRIRKQVIA